MVRVQLFANLIIKTIRTGHGKLDERQIGNTRNILLSNHTDYVEDGIVPCSLSGYHEKVLIIYMNSLT